jgi:threonine dehydrogenase-like Zn-dependent dehydrogenase
VRVPSGNTLPIPVPEGLPDERFVYLSDVLPTAWQAVEYAAIPPGGSVVALGLGPVGDMTARIAGYRGAGQVIGVDPVPERLTRARMHHVEALDLLERQDEIGEVIRDMTSGRGPDAVIDAGGMEAHGSTSAKIAQRVPGMLPDTLAAVLMQQVGADRLYALYLAIDVVRRGGTISVIGVYGGMTDPLPMLTIFNKQLQLRMGLANVKRWVGEILLLRTDGDPLGAEGFTTPMVPLDQAPQTYEMFEKKRDGAIKILFRP